MGCRSTLHLPIGQGLAENPHEGPWHQEHRQIQAFSEARRAADQRQTEYLPTYHRLRDTIHQLTGESTNEKFVHINVNKLVNKTAGLEAGQRPNADLSQQAMLIVAQTVATQAMQGAADHHDGYQLAKRSLSALAAVVNAQQLATHYGGQ